MRSSASLEGKVEIEPERLPQDASWVTDKALKLRRLD